jgi:hypothetical protein
MKLEFPIAVYIDGDFFVDDGRALRAMGASFPDAGTMRCKEALRRKDHGWILEAAGRFRELKLTGARREWARPLSFLWRFVRSEYSVSEGRAVTIGELKARMRGVVDRYPEAPVASEFRSFLGRYDDRVVISEGILRDWPI